MEGVLQMTENQIVARVKHWQKKLKLEHWKINFVFDEDPPPEAVAEVQIPDDYDRCHLAINMEKVNHDPNIDIDHIIAHELLHLTFRDLDQSYKLAREYFPYAGWRVYEDQMEHEIEGLVDRLATILSTN